MLNMNEQNLKELEEYRKLGTPQDLFDFMEKQSENIKKMINSYNKIREQFNEVNNMFIEFQAMIFIIIKDKLKIEGLITEGMNDIDQMDLIKSEYDKHYINMNTSEMRDMMIKYVIKDFEEGK